MIRTDGLKSYNSFMPGDEEKNLIRRSKNGEREAFRQLEARYYRRIFNFGYAMARNLDDASDIAQEAFVLAWTHIGNFRGESSFITYLNRIARNVSLDLRERRRHSPNLTVDDVLRLRDPDLPPRADGDSPI